MRGTMSEPLLTDPEGWKPVRSVWALLGMLLLGLALVATITAGIMVLLIPLALL